MKDKNIVHRKGFEIPDNLICPDCDGTDFIQDNIKGEIICIKCGLILGTKMIDDMGTFFGNSSEGGSAKFHYGDPISMYKRTINKTTKISKSDLYVCKNSDLKNAVRHQNKPTSAEKMKIACQNEIKRLCLCLNLPKHLHDHIINLTYDIYDTGYFQGRKGRLICAGVTFLACKNAGMGFLRSDVFDIVELDEDDKAQTVIKTLTKFHGNRFRMGRNIVENYLMMFERHVNAHHLAYPHRQRFREVIAHKFKKIGGSKPEALVAAAVICLARKEGKILTQDAIGGEFLVDPTTIRKWLPKGISTRI